MPIDIVYEDPEALGAAAYDAARNRQRRKNIELTLAQQLEADKANAQIGIQEERVNLDAAQLYEGLRQRDTDRRAQLEEAERNRAHDAGQLERRHRLGTDAALEMAGVNQSNDLGRIEAMSTARREELKFQLDETRRREVEQGEREMKALYKERDQGLWRPDDPHYLREQRQIQQKIDGILLTPPPQMAPAPDMMQQMIAKGLAKDLGGGSYLVTQPDGKIEHIDTQKGKKPGTSPPPDKEKAREAYHQLWRVAAKAIKDRSNDGSDPKAEDVQKEVDAIEAAFEAKWNKQHGVKTNGPPPAAGVTLPAAESPQAPAPTTITSAQVAPPQASMDVLDRELEDLYSKYDMGLGKIESWQQFEPADRRRYWEITNAQMALSSQQKPGGGDKVPAANQAKETARNILKQFRAQYGHHPSEWPDEVQHQAVSLKKILEL